MTNKRYFYGWAKQNEIVKKSSSGGLFYILAENVIHEGGIVFGVAVEQDGNVVLKSARNLVQLNLPLGSKYVQAEVGNVYNKIKKILASGRKVLFAGTPCQCKALNKFFGEWTPRQPFGCRFFLHGVPSRTI